MRGKYFVESVAARVFKYERASLTEWYKLVSFLPFLTGFRSLGIFVTRCYDRARCARWFHVVLFRS